MHERGFEMINRYGRVIGPTDRDVEWYQLPHWEFDGVGAFLHLLRKQGIPVEAPVLPRKRRGSWFARLRGIISYFRLVPVHAALWKRLEKTGGSPFSRTDEIAAYRVLSEEQTRRLVEAARGQGVSVNARLHWALARSVRDELVSGSGPHLWMIPVNMRGAVRKSPDTSNQQSLIWVDTEIAATPRDIEIQIEKRFGEAIHWGAWLVLNIGRLIGDKGMRKLLDRVERIGDRWVGTFSNLGAWKLEKSGPWLGFVPTSRSSPLGASCVTVNGRMSLCLQVQSGLCENPEELDRWIGRWVDCAMDA